MRASALTRPSTTDPSDFLRLTPTPSRLPLDSLRLPPTPSDFPPTQVFHHEWKRGLLINQPDFPGGGRLPGFIRFTFHSRESAGPSGLVVPKMQNPKRTRSKIRYRRHDRQAMTPPRQQDRRRRPPGKRPRLGFTHRGSRPVLRTSSTRDAKPKNGQDQKSVTIDMTARQ